MPRRSKSPSSQRQLFRELAGIAVNPNFRRKLSRETAWWSKRVVPSEWPARASTIARFQIQSDYGVVDRDYIFDDLESDFFETFAEVLGEVSKADFDAIAKRWLELRLRQIITDVPSFMADLLRDTNEQRREIGRFRTAAKVHSFAEEHIWDDGHLELFWLAEHPKCSLATAFMIYFRATPWDIGKTAFDKERVALASFLRTQVAADRYGGRLSYDPVSDLGWSKREMTKHLAAIPAPMRFRVDKGKLASVG